MTRKICALLALPMGLGCSPMLLNHPSLPSSGEFVTQLGVDTVAVERYTRTADRLEGDVALRSPALRVIHYVATLAADGRMTSLTTTVRRPTMPASAPALLSQTITFGPSTSVETIRNGQRDTARSGVKTYEGVGVGTIPSEPPSYGIYEQVIAGHYNGSTVALTQIGGPGPLTAPLALSTRGPDAVQFSSNFFPGTPWPEVVTLDHGRITGVNSTGTTVKTIAHRDDSLDFEKVLSGWEAQEAAGRVMGSASPLDSTRASIGGANLEVVYSRPSRRGRTIFGEVVPWGQVWRTGANAATMFTTSRDLMIGGKLVPAGKYTLWTLPTPNGAQLIINSQTGQWGTDYESNRDFARVDLATTMLVNSVEKFTISIDPSGDGGVLKLAWADRAYSVPFTVK